MSTKRSNPARFFAFIFLSTVCCTPIAAQSSPDDPAIAKQVQISRQGDLVSIDMELDVNHIKIGKNEVHIITPLLQSNIDQNMNASFSPVIISGTIRNKVVKREISLNTENNLGKLNPVAIIKKERRGSQIFLYQDAIPFEPWMEDASLVLNSENRGCAGCDMGNEATTLLARIFPEEFIPVWQLTYIEPEPEPVKVRSERHSASFNYPLDQYALLRQYKNNEAEFQKVDRVIKEVHDNKDLTITDFMIEGFASPEGGWEYNRILSEKRANSFADYLQTKHQIERSRIKSVKGIGEDWNGLRQAVESSDMADKQEILRIIDQVTPPDARDAQLIRLSGGNSYRFLLNNFYPTLRRTDYRIAYNVRSFSLEEAKAQIKSNPRLLSLNEMYLVAHSYPKESKEFKEVFDIAVRLFPNDPIAIINSAATDLERGNFAIALERMEAVKEDPRAWNNLGVTHARLGNMTLAAEYLKKGTNNGDSTAAANLNQLMKAMDNQ